MDELLRLLEQYDNGIADLTDEQLQQLLDDLQEEATPLLEGEPTDAGNEILGRVAAAVAGIREAQTEREGQAEQRRTEQAQRRAQILGQDEGGEDEDEGAEGGDDDGEPAPAESDEPAPDAEGEQPVPIAASGTQRTRVTRAAARRPRGMDPNANRQTAQPEPQLSLVAAANLPNVAAGTPLESPADLASAFMAAYKASQGYKGPRVKIAVARVGSELASRDMYGDERTLGSDARANDRLINAVLQADGGRGLTRDAIAASGGICAPQQVNYDMPTIGTDARPVRDRALVRFGADRGGVETFPPPTLADVDGSVTVWTETNDQNPSSPATKPCLTLTCPDPTTTLVEGLVRCFEIGNFRARYWMEQVEAWTRLGAVLHARTAEEELLSTIGGGSTQVSHGQILGTTSDVLTTLDLAVAALESRHRLEDNGPALVWVAPRWLFRQMRSDIARQMPGGGTLDERFALAEAQIDRWLTARNIMVVWALDGETGQEFGPQGDGPLVGWPSTAVTYLYPAGSWLFLDGGELDLGIVRDSTLNSTNDYQMFYESFEGAHFHGVESYRLTIDTCPDGTVSGAVTLDICGTGS